MTLKITIADAMLQHNTEMSPALMKPYVILHTGDSEYKTRASSGNNPTWGESILVSVREEDLTIEVFDMDQGIDDTIGHAFVKVRSLIGQPDIPQERVVALGYRGMQAGEIRLIVQYIEGKEYIGGLAPFQSKLMMAGQQLGQPPLQTQYRQQQQYPSQAMMQSGFPQGGMMTSMRSGVAEQNPNMYGNPTSQMGSAIYGNQMGSSIQPIQQFQQTQLPQTSTLYEQQTVILPQNPNSSQIIDPRATVFNPLAQPPPQMLISGGGPQDPLIFNSYNPQLNPGMLASQQGMAAGNVTIVGGTPSTINQAFGTRRMPIFKSGCPNLNWFSILDGENKPSQCMPPRLI